MAEDKRKSKSSTPMVITGSGDGLVVLRLRLFSGFAGPKHPECGGSESANTFEKSCRSEQRESKGPDAISLGRQEQRCRRNTDRSGDGPGFSGVAIQQTAPCRAGESSRCSNARSQHPKAGRPAMILRLSRLGRDGKQSSSLWLPARGQTGMVCLQRSKQSVPLCPLQTQTNRYGPLTRHPNK